MNQYIEKDKVLSLLGLDHNDYVYIDKRELAKRIEKLKGIDIVRCKECESYNTDGYTRGCGFCLYHHSVMEDNDFCSYGEH